MRNHSRNGFTMVEMLVVIVIITTLAGLSMAAAMRARHNSRVTATAGIMAKMATALGTYKSDFAAYPMYYPLWVGDTPTRDTNGSFRRTFPYRVEFNSIDVDMDKPGNADTPDKYSVLGPLYGIDHTPQNGPAQYQGFEATVYIRDPGRKVTYLDDADLQARTLRGNVRGYMTGDTVTDADIFQGILDVWGTPIHYVHMVGYYNADDLHYHGGWSDSVIGYGSAGWDRYKALMIDPAKLAGWPAKGKTSQGFYENKPLSRLNANELSFAAYEKDADEEITYFGNRRTVFGRPEACPAPWRNSAGRYPFATEFELWSAGPDRKIDNTGDLEYDNDGVTGLERMHDLTKEYNRDNISGAQWKSD